MNILFLTTHFNTGGITSYIMTLSKELIASGNHVYVASSGGNMVEDLERIGGKHFLLNIRTKSILSWKIYAAFFPVRHLVESHHIDIIHSHTRITQFLGWIIQRFLRVPYVSTCHGFFRPRLVRKIFPCWGNKVIAISDQVAGHLKKDFGIVDQYVATIRNGIDLKDFSVSSQVERENKRREFGYENKLVVGIIARLSDVKGHRVLLDAFVDVRLQVSNVHLVIVGQGKEEGALKKQVQDLGLMDFVDFYPAINRMSDFLMIFDCFVMPSLQEGLGLSVMEAQTFGLPIVASCVGGLPSLIEDGETGILVEPGNAAELSQAIIRVLSDPDFSRLLGERARQKAEREYGSHEMAEKILGVYKQVASDK